MKGKQVSAWFTPSKRGAFIPDMLGMEEEKTVLRVDLHRSS
jgi:hypothetical protein